VLGLYKATYFEHGGKRKSSRLTAYYVTTPNTLPQKPGGNTKSYKDMVSKVPKPTNTRQNPTVKRSVPIQLVPAKTKTTNKSSAPIQKRRRRNDDDIQPTKNVNQFHPEQPAAEPAAEPASVVVLVVNDPPNANANAILTQSWWDTGDAICYFGAIDGEVSPMEAVVERIARLQRGYTTATGWKLVIDDFDQQELCSRHKAFSFQLKCRYVSLALRYAVEDMPLKTWLGCCSEAMCNQNNIPIEEELDEVVEGWEGKPKGMLQILWERGFVDPSKKKENYTLQGKKDAFGKVDPETSLKHLMSLLTDFIEESNLAAVPWW
jgi:hypothetical protein